MQLGDTIYTLDMNEKKIHWNLTIDLNKWRFQDNPESDSDEINLEEDSEQMMQYKKKLMKLKEDINKQQDQKNKL